MSKKLSQVSPPPSAAAGDAGAAVKLLCPERVRLDVAMARLAPFIFAIDTDTRELVDLKNIIAAVVRDPGVAPSLFQIDRLDAANFAAALTDPNYAALSAEVKAQLPAIAEGGGDPWVIAQCIRCRIVAIAVEREEARLDEEEAAAARHVELVERMMEEGLTRAEAERAAREEEEAAAGSANTGGAAGGGAAGGDEDEDGAIQRPQAFIMLKGFPVTPADIAALSTLKVPLDAIFCVNSLARLGRREEPIVDPKAKGAKKPEAKKADTKKAGGKGGKGAADDAAAPPPESLAQALTKERARVAPFDSTHPLRHTVVWTYDVQCIESKTGAVDDATGAKLYDLQETEAEVAEKVTTEVNRVEQAAHDYRTWAAAKALRKVAGVKTGADAARAHGHDDDLDVTTEAAAAAAAAAAQAELQAKADQAKAPAPGGKKAPAGAAAGAKGGKATAAVEAEQAAPETPAAAPAVPPLPHSAKDIAVEDELYRRLVDEVAPSSLSLDIRMHCLLEQVQDTISTARAASAAAAATTTAATAAAATTATSSSSAASIAESIATKTKRDVADFCDYVLAQLDGTQEQVFEACRKRRLKAAEAADPNGAGSGGASGGGDDMDQPRLPLADATYLRLMPATKSTIDPDALLLGVPLRRVEARVRRAVQAGALSDKHMTVAKTDLPTLASLEHAGRLFRHLLMDRVGLSENEVATIMRTRTQGQLFSVDGLKERLVDVFQTEPDSHVYKATCQDGSYVLVMTHSVPAERRRFQSLWAAFHGHVAFPQWLALADFAKSEDLFFHPPPRDDDDFDDEPQDDGANDEDEEDEEDEEVGVDDDGEPIVRKKAKKVVIYPPEYTNNDVTVTSELRRRATLDMIKQRLGLQPEELLLADNHTSSLAHLEQQTLYPSDGSIISVQTAVANQKTLHCTVYADTGVSFGFRSAVHRSQDEDESPLSQSVPASAGGDGLLLPPKSPKTSPRGHLQSTTSSAAAPTAAAPVADSDGAAADGSSVGGPRIETSGVTAIINLHEDAMVHISASCPVVHRGSSAPPQRRQSTVAGGGGPVGNSTPPPSTQLLTPAPPVASQRRSSDAGSAAPADGATTARPGATVRAVLHSGVTVELNPAGSVRLIPEAPRESPVTVFNPLTRQVTRVSLLESYRTILVDGTVLCSFEDGSKMNLFANGNTAVFHEGFWLITNAAGRRVLKDAAGNVTPLVVSLVTSNTDTETLSKLTTREDGVVTVNYDDGKMLAQHIDGTRMWRDPGRTIVEIEADGLPKVFAVPGGGLAKSVPLPRRSRLCVKTTGDLSFVLVPEEYVTITHPSSGFRAGVDLQTLVLHCDVHPDSATRYVMDLAFSGLRVLDGPKSYHVTPFGRVAAHNISEDQPVAPTQEPGVKQVIDIFMRPEEVKPRFAAAMRALGRPAEASLHMMPDVPLFTLDVNNASVAGMQAPPRSRQLREKETGCVALLEKAMPPGAKQHAVEAPTTMRPPLLFVCGPHGGLELVRRADMRTLVGAATHRSNLLFTDVHREPVGVLEDEDADMDAAGNVTPSPPPNATGPDAAPAPKTYGKLQQSIIISTAPPRQATRSGIPKILVDLRRASARSGPISVGAFLHELKQGPQMATKPGAHSGGNGGAGAGDDGGSSITVATRHFLTLDPALWEPNALSTASTGGGLTPLPAPGAGDPCYERALLHLARSIPPVIAAQLMLLPQNRLVSTTRGRRTNTGGSRSSRGGTAAQQQQQQAGGGKNLPPKKTSSSGKPEEDPEFATQMEQLAQKEKANRKPWPNPIGEIKQRIAETQGATTGNFWATGLGAAELPRLQQANAKYTAAGGYRKVPVPQYVSQQPPPPTAATATTAAAAPTTVASGAKPTSPDVVKGTRPPQGGPIPTPPRVPRGANGSTGIAGGPAGQLGASAALLAARSVASTGAWQATHTSPAGMLTTALPAAPTATTQPRAPPMLAATPHSIHLGNIVAGHRYAVDVKLTNVGSAACRYRVVVEPAEAAEHVTVSAPLLALAPGISTSIIVEIAGTQPHGVFRATLTATCVGGAIQIPLHATTAADSGRGSAGHPRPGVRILGPTFNTASGQRFVPGTTKRAKQRAQSSANEDSDDDGM
jgi:hypothetical protein